jgi:hypothetical protein
MARETWEDIERERDELREQLEAMHETLLMLAEGRVDFGQWQGVYLAAKAQNSNPAKNPLRKPGRSSECGHDGWQSGCAVCEREERDALRAMGEQSPATSPTDDMDTRIVGNQWRYGEGRLLPDERDPASRRPS